MSRHWQLMFLIYAFVSTGALAACDELEVPERVFYCSPDDPNTCPDGWVCEYFESYGHHFCSSTPQFCGPNNCSGCCDAEGWCVEGGTDFICGRNGLSCVDCTVNPGSFCSGDTCQPPSCVDADLDGYGENCVLGDDCDDDAPGVVGPCEENGCPTGWVPIDEGPFWMGCDDSSPSSSCLADQLPMHEVTLSAYCVEPTEVMVGDYRACLQAGVCTGVPRDTDTDTFCNWTGAVKERELHPVNCIDWPSAAQYCQLWLGGTLPSEAQWEKAARGAFPEQRIYPWGDSPNPECSYCNFNVFDGDGAFGCSYAASGPGTWEANAQPPSVGESPFGVMQMAGNVWEWVQDWYQDDFYSSCATGCVDPLGLNDESHLRVARGGAFDDSDPRRLRVYFRDSLTEVARLRSVGLRCARSR